MNALVKLQRAFADCLCNVTKSRVMSNFNIALSLFLQVQYSVLTLTEKFQNNVSKTLHLIPNVMIYKLCPEWNQEILLPIPFFFFFLKEKIAITLSNEWFTIH